EAPPDYGTLARLAPVIAELGLPLAIHAEDPGILKTFRRPYETYADVLAGQPPEAEAVAISAAAAVARQHGIHLHIAHLSSAAGLFAAEEALAVGTAMTLETCPQFLAYRGRLCAARDVDEDEPACSHPGRSLSSARW